MPKDADPVDGDLIAGLHYDDRDPELLSYKDRTSHSTDAEDSLQWRHELLLRRFLGAVPDILLKDGQRSFTHEQRMAIYRRDHGICQLRLKCAGTKVEWDAFEADHIIPWSKGGPTTVANGQVACAACNAAKNNGE